MKKNLILTLILVLLGAGAWWLLNTDRSASGNLQERSFFIEDPEQISKIFIAHRTDNYQVTLERKGEHWIMDGNAERKVRPGVINFFLDAVKRQRVKFQVPNAQIKFVVDMLTKSGIKMMFYDKEGKNFKTFYVGMPTKEEDATYMIMEGSDVPYAVEIPGIPANLRERYDLVGDEWRDRSLFSEKPEQIDSLTIEYPLKKSDSFVLSRASDGSYNVVPFYPTTPAVSSKPDPNLVAAYLEHYRSIVAENFINDLPEKGKLGQRTPFARVRLVRRDGGVRELKFIEVIKPKVQDSTDALATARANIFHYHVEASWGDLYLAQQLVTGKLFYRYHGFFR